MDNQYQPSPPPHTHTHAHTSLPPPPPPSRKLAVYNWGGKIEKLPRSSWNAIACWFLVMRSSGVTIWHDRSDDRKCWNFPDLRITSSVAAATKSRAHSRALWPWLSSWWSRGCVGKEGWHLSVSGKRSLRGQVGNLDISEAIGQGNMKAKLKPTIRAVSPCSSECDSQLNDRQMK